MAVIFLPLKTNKGEKFKIDRDFKKLKPKFEMNYKAMCLKRKILL
jgi:hypothetical protein